jgi:hypothetical protein
VSTPGLACCVAGWSQQGGRARSESVLAPCAMLAWPASLAIELIDLPFSHLWHVAVNVWQHARSYHVRELDWLVRTIRVHTTAMLGAARRAHVCRTVHRRCRRGRGAAVDSRDTTTKALEERCGTGVFRPFQNPFDRVLRTRSGVCHRLGHASYHPQTLKQAVHDKVRTLALHENSLLTAG